MCLTLGASNNPVSAAARDVIQTLPCFDVWSRVSVRQKYNTCGTCQCSPPTDHTDASQCRCRDGSSGTPAVDKLTSAGFPKYFVTISCNRTTTSGAHFCFQTIDLHGCNYANGYDDDTLRMGFSHTVFCGETKRALHEGEDEVHNSHQWAWDSLRAIHCNVSVWDGLVVYIVAGPFLLPDRLTAQQYRGFLETVLTGLLQDVPLAVRQILWVQHGGASTRCGEAVR